MGCGCKGGGGGGQAVARNTGRSAVPRSNIIRSANSQQNAASPPVFGVLPVQRNNPTTLTADRLLIEKRRRDAIFQALGRT
jgi:hypothetical protein